MVLGWKRKPKRPEWCVSVAAAAAAPLHGKYIQWSIFLSLVFVLNARRPQPLQIPFSLFTTTTITSGEYSDRHLSPGKSQFLEQPPAPKKQLLHAIRAAATVRGGKDDDFIVKTENFLLVLFFVALFILLLQCRSLSLSAILMVVRCFVHCTCFWYTKHFGEASLIIYARHELQQQQQTLHIIPDQLRFPPGWFFSVLTVIG